MSVNVVKLASNVFQCNTFVFENKRRTGYDMNIEKIKLYTHGASVELEAY